MLTELVALRRWATAGAELLVEMKRTQNPTRALALGDGIKD